MRNLLLGLLAATVFAGIAQSAGLDGTSTQVATPAQQAEDDAENDPQNKYRDGDAFWYWVNPYAKQRGDFHYECVGLGYWVSPLRSMRSTFPTGKIKLISDTYEGDAHVAIFEHAGQKFYFTTTIRHCSDMLDNGEPERGAPQ